MIAGNCGFTLAPCKPQDREYISQMLAVVEDMSLAALKAGLSWDWEDFTSFVTTLERRPKAINIGFYVGHSTFRRYVMGADFRRAATEAEIASMQNVVIDAIDAGALGWSTSRIPAHVDGERKSVPSFYADICELLALARALCKTGRDRGCADASPAPRRVRNRRPGRRASAGRDCRTAGHVRTRPSCSQLSGTCDLYPLRDFENRGSRGSAPLPTDRLPSDGDAP